MSQKSISQKLSDLFDLYNSGALSKKEYDLLKSEIIAEGENRSYEVGEKIILPSVEDESITDSVQESELLPEPIPDSSIILSGNIQTNVHLDSNSWRKNYHFLLFVFGLLFIVAVILIVYKSGLEDTNSKVIDSVSSQLSTSNNSTTGEGDIKWDEHAAKKIVMNELTKYPDWSNYANEESGVWKHEILSFKRVLTSDNEYMVALTISYNFSQDEYWNCYSQVSYFEFDKKNKWNLSRKSIAFTTGGKGGTAPDKMTTVSIAQNKYGIYIEQMEGSQGYATTNSSIYSHIDESLKCLLSLITCTSNEGVEKQENYKGIICFKNEGKEFYTIELLETGTDDDGKVIDNKIRYEFNGQEYMNISGIQPYGHPY